MEAEIGRLKVERQNAERAEVRQKLVDATFGLSYSVCSLGAKSG
ncbi:MAG: hypothetical protein AB7G08_33410 [Hyphomicrobiaceae bacterium]